MSDHDDMDDGSGGEHHDRKEGADQRLAVSRRNAQWTERYRPSLVEDLILPPRIRDLLEGSIRVSHISHLLFAGPAGVGKTTAARALCEAVGVDAYVINASLDRGIDVVRNQIIPFASCYSFSRAGKVVVLEEADSLTD
jgi:DNA polymerase III delta prime subunit